VRASSAPPPVLLPRSTSTGSRRRRLWELGTHAHCPVLGVCLPISALRRLLDKVLGGQTQAEDYEIHCGAIAECTRRTPIAEAVQRELDRRCMGALRQAALAKTAEALAAWWQQAAGGHDLPGALWATLTHARCTVDLEQQVLAEVHMLQHQVGSARRVDLQRFGELVEENAVLARELALIQQRVTRQAAQQAQRIEAQQAEIVRLRAELMGRDTALAALRQDQAVLEAAAPGLKQRFELTRQTQVQLERIHELQRALLLAEQAREHQREQANTARAELAQALAAAERAPFDAATEPAGAPPELRNRSVLCVGGRTASVPAYRQVIEKTGGRFLHHDGGEEDNPNQLDNTLAAADLVICQTGCISHDAYWRVKDHCKRTGKRCVFVDTPSRSSLERALQGLQQPRVASGGV
jgi:hypothetical protein